MWREGTTVSIFRKRLWKWDATVDREQFSDNEFSIPQSRCIVTAVSHDLPHTASMPLSAVRVWGGGKGGNCERGGDQ